MNLFHTVDGFDDGLDAVFDDGFDDVDFIVQKKKKKLYAVDGRIPASFARWFIQL